MDYRHRIQRAIEYLEADPSQDLSLADLARKAHLSPYYFHRIFKAVTGETPSDHIRRLRLQKAASHLFMEKQRRVLEIALMCGFQSSQSMAKAFRKYFDLTPSDIRQCQDFEAYSALMQQSKIGHQLRKIGHDLDRAIPDTESLTNKRQANMQIESHPARTLASIRVTGAYGQGYEPAMNKLFAWAGMRGIEAQEVIFLYHDNPEVTPEDQCRTDVCFAVPEDVVIEGEVVKIELPECRCASVRVTMQKPSDYAQAWQDLMSQVVAAQLPLSDVPCFEIYHHYDPVTHEAEVSCCSVIETSGL